MMHIKLLITLMMLVVLPTNYLLRRPANSLIVADASVPIAPVETDDFDARQSWSQLIKMWAYKTFYSADEAANEADFRPYEPQVPTGTQESFDEKVMIATPANMLMNVNLSSSNKRSFRRL